MIKVESITLEKAYEEAAEQLKCSVTELVVEVVQVPSNGFLGMFKKKAIIVATVKEATPVAEKKVDTAPQQERTHKEEIPSQDSLQEEESPIQQSILNDTIVPTSFVSDQDEELEEDLASGLDYTADYDDAYDEDGVDEDMEVSSTDIALVAAEVQEEINKLFSHICFEIDEIIVQPYDEETLLIGFNGEDAALLIGKEGYRYKALSYMLFNWINAKYGVQLRLEIAEFLQNQEEAVSRYLESIYDIVENEGRAQTKILDGVLVQIALKLLRARYPDKYVVIRSTKDGLKYIIVNDYLS